jgi:hypothetical protein
MIQMPTRSVTRFFIPMIDVLTLLFCIYLIMPMVDTAGEAELETERQAREARLKQLESELARLGSSGEQAPAKLREELERLRKEKIETLKNRLSVRVLEIDPANGKLYFRDPDRVEIRDAVEAHQLIERDRQTQGVARRELYYLVLYPRDRTSGYPTREQRQGYDRWFDGVALGYDVPGLEPGKEK